MSLLRTHLSTLLHTMSNNWPSHTMWGILRFYHYRASKRRQPFTAGKQCTDCDTQNHKLIQHFNQSYLVFICRLRSWCLMDTRDMWSFILVYSLHYIPRNGCDSDSLDSPLKEIKYLISFCILLTEFEIADHLALHMSNIKSEIAAQVSLDHQPKQEQRNNFD